MSDISLSKAVRSNLLSLQNTAELMASTQERLSTGNKVNSALDNPTNFFTAASLNSRAGDLNSLMDSMANGIQTLEAADNGLTSITKTLESMQSTLRQARQDKTFLTNSYTIPPTGFGTGDTISFSGGSIGTTPLDVELMSTTSTTTAGAYTAVDFTNSSANNGSISFNISVNGSTPPTAISITHAEASAVATSAAAVTVDEMAELINNELTAANLPATAAVTGGVLTITGASANESVADVTISGFAVANGATGSGLANAVGTDAAPTPKTLDALVSEINRRADLKDKIRASNDNGRLRIENLSTQELEIDGISSTGVIDGASTAAASIGGNTVRADLATQFNELRDQLDKLSDDASFNGINLLRGDNLKITFNETGTSEIDIQTKDQEALNAANLNIFDISAIDLDSDTNIDAQLANLKTALNDVRSQSSAFGSNLSIVQNRQDFTKEMINTLETGAANLTLADMNEEAANLLALQTRQSLSSSSLSLASQADQSVLQLLQ